MESKTKKILIISLIALFVIGAIIAFAIYKGVGTSEDTTITTGGGTTSSSNGGIGQLAGDILKAIYGT